MATVRRCALSSRRGSPEALRAPESVCLDGAKRMPRRESSIHIADWPVLEALRDAGRPAELSDNAYLCEAHHASLIAFLRERAAAAKAAVTAARDAQRAKVKEDEDLERAHGPELDELQRLPRADALRRLAVQRGDALKLQRQLREATRTAEAAREASEKKEAELRAQLRRNLDFHRISWAKLSRLPQSVKKDELCRALFGFDWSTLQVGHVFAGCVW
jgi:hypothetical protein